MKKSLTIILFSLLCLFLILASVFTIFYISSTSVPNIVFYKIDQKTQKAFENYLLSLLTNAKGQRPKINFIRLSDEKSLENQLSSIKKPDILFTENSFEAKNTAKTLGLTNESAALENLPGTQRKVADGYAWPLLFDYFEVLSKKAVSENLSDFTKKTLQLKKASGSSPIYFAGKDDKTLFQLVTALTEALTGSDGLLKLTESLKENLNFSQILETSLSEKYTFKDVLNTLLEWKNQGLLFSEVLYMTPQDIKYFVENGTAEIVFLPLSSHRTIDSKKLSGYKSYVFPADISPNNRSYVSPAVIGMPLSKRVLGNSMTPNLILNAMLSSETQMKLSSNSGLSPASASSKTADRQANDTRFWIASATQSLQDFVTASVLDVELQKEYAENIRNYISLNGQAW